MFNLKNSKILVTVDGSYGSIEVANFTLDITKTYTSPVIAMVVSCVPLSIKLSSTDRLKKWHKNNIKEARKWLNDLSAVCYSYIFYFFSEISNHYNISFVFMTSFIKV
jgi:nucleotide-binding universal stress UspA family protein